MNKISTYTVLISSLVIGSSFCINAKEAKLKQVDKTIKWSECALSDYAVAGERIKNRFEKWIEKGEFEKTIAYEARLQNESLKVFISICREEIQRQGGYFKIELQRYNADKEYFPVVVQKKFRQVKEEYNLVDKWETVAHVDLKVSVEEAKELKSYYDNGRVRTVGMNLVWVGNNFIAANYLLHTPNRKYKLNNPVDNSMPIIYSKKSLNINNEKLPPIEFNNSNYTNEPREFVNETELETNDIIFTNVEIFPEFPGGMEAFYKFLSKTKVFPPMSREKNIEGRVTVNFVVEKDGSLTDIKVLRGVPGGEDLSQEAIRVLKKSPKWQAGIQNGRPVRVSYSVPILFQLGE